jgi:hypothetical protein
MRVQNQPIFVHPLYRTFDFKNTNYKFGLFIKLLYIYNIINIKLQKKWKQHLVNKIVFG